MLRSRIDFEGFERSDVQNLEKFILLHFAFSRHFTVYREAERHFNTLLEAQKCLGTSLFFFFNIKKHKEMAEALGLIRIKHGAKKALLALDNS